MTAENKIERLFFGYRCPRIEEAARRGAVAFIDEWDHDGSPFPIDTAEHYAWCAGWAKAKAENFAFIEDHPELAAADPIDEPA